MADFDEDILAEIKRDDDYEKAGEIVLEMRKMAVKQFIKGSIIDFYDSDIIVTQTDDDEYYEFHVLDKTYYVFTDDEMKMEATDKLKQIVQIQVEHDECLQEFNVMCIE